MIELTLIGITKIDWPSYLNLTKQLIGRSLNTKLDEKNIPIDNLGAFIATLGQLKDVDANPIETIRDPGSLASHASITMLLIASKDITYLLIQETRLNFTIAQTVSRDYSVSIISGNLEQWRNALVNCCRAEYDLRIFLNKALVILNNAGLYEFFNNYTRRYQADGTFMLEEKK